MLRSLSYNPPPNYVISRGAKFMKKDIHPQYEEITVTCSCGNAFVTRSTACKNLHTDICSLCHPFTTGKQQDSSKARRVDGFNKRFGGRSISGKKPAVAPAA